jgi:hypothetical protein
MRLGLYVLASIILMAMVGVFIYTINPNTYSQNMFGVYITMPIAVWIMIPMFLLMVVSFIHMMFYGTKNFFKFKRWEKDSETLNSAIYWSLLNEPKAYKFNLPKLKETAALLQVSNIKANGTVDGVSEKIQSALNIISEIEKGECVDFKEKKLSNVLSDNNPLVTQNYLNCLEKDESFTETVLQNRDRYNETVFKEALNRFTNHTTFFKARKYSEEFDRDNFMKLICRVNRDEDLGLDVTILDEFIVSLHSELKCSDFLLVANITKKLFSPDDNLKLFGGYDKKYTKAQTAYLYLIFDYEMIDKAGEYLDQHDSDEFMRFRALYDLKKEHTKYKITDLMNIKHICNDA